MTYRTISFLIALTYVTFGPASVLAAERRPTSVSVPNRPDNLRSSSVVQNRFAAARGLSLRDSDIDLFIDQRITGTQRKLAHSLLAGMPPNLRGDFLYLLPNGQVFSNNLALLPYAQVRYTLNRVIRGAQSVKSNTPSSAGRTHQFSSGRRVMSSPSSISPLDYGSSCSPPNPPASPDGAYVRLVSPCGFATGWGFINIPQGDSYMPSGDSGNAYFEIQGPGGNAVEGGLEYYSDTSIAPYLRSTAAPSPGYVTMTNNSNRYFAGEILGLFHGITPNISTLGGTGNLAYTIVGALSSSQDPQTDFVDSIAVQLVNPSWLFYTAPSDMTGAGVDAAGVTTPCSRCSVSQVTSIAQSVSSYAVDGAYFGVDSIGDDTIQWLQVAFGEWTSACVPGASVCPFSSSANPYVYYGGAQYYPSEDVSQSNVAPTGYGPYETYTGIDLSGDFDQSFRKTLGTFKEPFPPLPCTADADSNCAIVQAKVVSSTCNTGEVGVHGQPIIIDGYTTRYSVYRKGSPAQYLETATEIEILKANTATHTCSVSEAWSPNNPSVQYSDANLP